MAENKTKEAEVAVEATEAQATKAPVVSEAQENPEKFRNEDTEQEGRAESRKLDPTP